MLDRDIKEFFLMALPMIGSRLVSVFSSFFSMLMIARSSVEAAAACALISSLLGFYLSSSQAMLVPVAIEYSGHYGNNEPNKADSVFFHGLLISGILFVAWLGLVLLPPYVGRFFSIEASVVVFLKKYFLNITIGIFCIQVYSVFNQLLSGRNKQFIETVFALIGVAVFSFSAYLIQLKNNDFYVAIIYSSNISAIFLLAIYIYYFSDVFKIKLQIDVGLFGSLLRSGLTIFTQTSAELAAFTAITLLLGKLGNNVLAAHRECMQISLVIILIALAMGQAASVLVARKKHELNELDLKKFMLKILVVIAIVYFLFGILLLLIKDFIISPLVSSEFLSEEIFLLFILTLYLDAIRHTSSGILRGLGNYKLPTFAGIFGLWGICMPCILLLSYFDQLTFLLVRVMLFVGIAVACFIQLISCKNMAFSENG